MLRRFAGRPASRIHALRALYKNFLRDDCPATRALRLLRSWLTPEQRAQLDAEGYFEVIGSHTGKRYRIYYKTSTNVYEKTSTNVYELAAGGEPVVGWCFSPVPKVPVGDVMLAQKIALELRELNTLALANNFTTARWPPSTEYPFNRES
jgi:hypothetical protein